MPGTDVETALYRMYDEAGTLLYVGISMSFPARMAAHTRSGRPWTADIAEVKVETHPSRPAALEAEATAIRDENPLHNIQRPGVGRPQPASLADYSDDPAAEYQRRWRAEKARQEGREPGKPGRPATQPCGTVAAYKRHQRHGETPCDPCRAAWSEKQREMYRKRTR